MNYEDLEGYSYETITAARCWAIKLNFKSYTLQINDDKFYHKLDISYFRHADLSEITFNSFINRLLKEETLKLQGYIVDSLTLCPDAFPVEIRRSKAFSKVLRSLLLKSSKKISISMFCEFNNPYGPILKTYPHIPCVDFFQALMECFMVQKQFCDRKV